MTNRPIYLVSVTPSHDPAVTDLPLLGTKWLHPAVDLSRAEGIIFTSKNGVDAMERIDPAWKTLPVLCVGKATRRRAVEMGATVLETAEGYGANLYDIIRSRYAAMRWLYARPAVVASDFAERLRAEGIVIDEAVVYETVCRTDCAVAAIEPGGVLIFTSPSALACFRRGHALLPGHTIVAIGRTTAQQLSGHTVHLAPEPTLAACIALAKQLAKETK